MWQRSFAFCWMDLIPICRVGKILSTTGLFVAWKAVEKKEIAWLLEMIKRRIVFESVFWEIEGVFGGMLMLTINHTLRVIIFPWSMSRDIFLLHLKKAKVNVIASIKKSGQEDSPACHSKFYLFIINVKITLSRNFEMIQILFFWFFCLNSPIFKIHYAMLVS